MTHRRLGVNLWASALLLTAATAQAQPADPPPAPEPPPPQPPPPEPPPPAPLPPPTPAPPTAPVPYPPTPYPPTAPYPPTTPYPYPPAPTADGLTPPAPLDPSQTENPNPQEQELDKSEKDDTERGLKWFYIDAEGGFQHVGLETFEVDESQLTAGLVPTEANGGYVGVGLGLRLFVLTIGPRARVGFFEDWQLYNVGGELGFRFQVSIVEPHFELGGGYAALGSLGDALGGVPNAGNVTGAYGPRRRRSSTFCSATTCTSVLQRAGSSWASPDPACLSTTSTPHQKHRTSMMRRKRRSLPRAPALAQP